MTQIKARPEPPCADIGQGHVVRRPRASDAVGTALRHAFAPEAALPGDLIRSLQVLDGAC